MIKFAKNIALAAVASLASSAALAQQPIGPNDTALAATVAADKTVAIVGGKLLTVTHGVIENGTVVLSGGKIVAVGPAGSTQVPTGATVIDAKGMTVYPGLFDSETQLGLVEVEADPMARDVAETADEIEPQMHVYDAFHAESARIPVERLNGVTNAVIAPEQADSLPGQDAVIQLYGKDRDSMLLGRDVALAMNFEGAIRRKANFNGGSSKFPTTRMGVASQLRQTFLDAQHYELEMQAAGKPDHKGVAPERDLKLEALLPYLHGQRPVVLSAVDSYEVEVGMGIAQEFHLKVILNNVTHSQDILDKIAGYHVPVIVGPIYEFPRANERYDAVYSLPAELSKRGVTIAIASADTLENGRNLPYAAGYAVAYGLPYDEALKAITLNPATMFGMGDQLGSLDVGKTGNVVLADGDPLDVRTSVKQVFIGGVAVPMVSRQTQLRDEYLPLTKGQMKQ